MSPPKRYRFSSPKRGPWPFIAAAVFLFLCAFFPSLRLSEFIKELNLPFLEDIVVTPKTVSAGYNNILVVRVVDGDTLELENKERVRLIGVDTPESRKNEKALKDSKRSGMDVEKIIELGQEAKIFTQGLLENKRVRLEFDVGQKDKYGRLLAYVYIHSDQIATFNDKLSYVQNSNGEIFVNATLMKAGYASPMTIPPNVKFADLFRGLYEEARLEKRGLWQGERLVQKE